MSRRVAPAVAASALAIAMALGALPGSPGATATAATPATGYLINADGSLYSLNTATMSVSHVGAAQGDAWGLAAGSDGVLYEVAGGIKQSLYKVNRSTAAPTLVGALDPAQPDSTVYGALGATSNGALYSELTSYATSTTGQFATVNRSTAAATSIGSPTDRVLTALAGGCGDLLYGIDADNVLVKVTKSTGAMTTVGQLSSSSLTAAEAAIALGVDHGTGAMWAITAKLDGTKRVWRVSPSTGALTATTYVDGQEGASPVAFAFDSPSRCTYGRKVGVAYSRSTHRFHGTLTASYAPCRSHQQVVIYRKRSGPDLKLGTTTTTATGTYRLAKAFQHGRYYAVAPQVNANGICLRAVSTTLQL